MMTPIRTKLVVVSTALALSVAAPGQAEERLGKITFPVSCGPAVGKSFERAAAMLHSFWYLEANKAFAAVAKADPDCAMAHWGTAMTVW